MKNFKIKNSYDDMRVEVLLSKIHRATITDSNLNYVGSISIHPKLVKKAKLFEGMKVEILNINNGERFSTYVILPPKNKKSKVKEICINGAAARKVQKGDVIIIVAYANMRYSDAKKIKPNILFVDSKNNILKKEK